MIDPKTALPAAVDRRQFLCGAASMAMAAATNSGALAQTPPAAAASSQPVGCGLLMREAEPENSESPFALLDGPITTPELLYVRNHFPTPVLDAKSWRLRIEGAVDRPLDLTLEDILRLPAHTRTVTMECAGNGRVYLVPKQGGVQWQQGAVGTSEWTGVLLSDVLAKAGIKRTAVEVVLEGADQGQTFEEPRSGGVIQYARGLPIDRVSRGDVLLANRLAGRELTPAHGFPLRAVVPNWYGMAAVKWLTRILVLERPFNGYFQTMHYTVWERRDGQSCLTRVDEMVVKSQIARPVFREIVAAGKPCRIIGAAWTGDSTIASVDISVDAGHSWTPARLLDDSRPGIWRRFEHAWNVPPQPGRHVLMSRARDARGQLQPMSHDPLRRNYLINFCVPIEVQSA